MSDRAATTAIGAPVVKTAIQEDRLPLVLRQYQLVDRTKSFFEKLHGNQRLQDEFIGNPSAVLVSFFVPPGAAAKISPQRLSNANRILYSAVANEGFRNWALAYQAAIEKTDVIDKQRITRDLSAAIVRYGDIDLLQGLMENIEIGDGTNELVFAMSRSICVCISATAFIAVTAETFLIMGAVGNAGSFNAAEARALSERIVSKARELAASGELARTQIP